MAVRDYRQALNHCWADSTYIAPRAQLPCPQLASGDGDAVEQYGDASVHLAQFARYVHRLGPVKHRSDMASLATQHGKRDAVEALRLSIDAPAFVDAVVDQAKSSAKIVTTCAFATHEVATVHAANYVRFLAFVQRIRAQTTTPVIPTLGIDLAWHAHMNHPASYAADTQALVGYIVDHKFGAEDLEGVDVEAARELLREMWVDQFGDQVPNPYAPTENDDGVCAVACFPGCLPGFCGTATSSSSHGADGAGDAAAGAASCVSCVSCAS